MTLDNISSAIDISMEAMKSAAQDNVLFNCKIDVVKVQVVYKKISMARIFPDDPNLFEKGWLFMGILVNRFYCRKLAMVFVIAVLRVV